MHILSVDIMATNNTSTFTLRSILKKDKLSGTNFLRWSRNLRIVLKQERKSYVLDTMFPLVPPSNAPRAQKDAYEKHLNESMDITSLILATMVPDLQKQFEAMKAFDMTRHLKEMFQEQARHERFVTIKGLTSCKMAPGTRRVHMYGK